MAIMARRQIVTVTVVFSFFLSRFLPEIVFISAALE